MRRRMLALCGLASFFMGDGEAIARPISGPSNLPDVPGAVDPAVTPDNIDAAVCVSGYARSVRPPYSYTGAIKRQLMRSQHPGERFSGYELDHLIPLALGGAPADRRNLWLEPWTGDMNAADKDALEFVLWRLVCRHEVPLHAAQQAIAQDWVGAYRRYATRQNLARFHYNHSGGE